MEIRHPFEATLKQMRKPKEQGGGYANLSDQQRREWHADIYAFNEVMLGRKASPCDPDREWFDAGRIEIAARYYRAKLEDRNRSKAGRERARSEEQQREGRDIVNRWAQGQGYADLEAYAAAKGMAKVEYAYADYFASREFAAVLAKIDAKTRAPAAPFEPGPQSMAEARRQLGIPEPIAREINPDAAAAG